jgi:hypothetical protein
MAPAVAVLGLLPTVLFAAGFTAGLDRGTVTVGESATLTFTFEGGEPSSVPAPPSLPNLRVGNPLISHNFSSVNGHSSSTISESFELTPTQPGEYPIPAFKVEIDGQTLASQPLKLKAVKAGAAGGTNSAPELAFLKMFVPKTDVYLGEVIEVQLQLFIREGVINAEGILRDFDSLSASPLKAEGFSVLKAAHAQSQRVQIGSLIYDQATLVTTLSPVKTGPLTIEGINFTIILQLPSANQQRNFFFLQSFQEKRVPVATDPQIVTVLPLPPDAPADFNGAVGTYTLTATAGPTNVATGDPITVKVQLSGTGALDALALPEQSAWADFKRYSATSKIEPSDPLGTTGTKTFEEVVVPQHSDIKELPPVTFCYFDSDRKTYQTLTSAAIPLTVRPGGSTAVPANAANRTGTENPGSTPDIVTIKQRPGELLQITAPLVKQPWFLALQGVPMLAWLSILGWRKRSDLLAHNPRLRRRRQVAQITRAGLTRLRRSAAESKSDEFFATVFRLLQEQLGEVLDRPASAITEAVIEDSQLTDQAPEAVLNELRDLFQTCNLVRYAPVTTSGKLAALIPKIESLLRQLQKLS